MIASLFAYFALLLVIAVYSRRRASGNKALDYFLGGRKLGIVSMAMTTAATYISASSFIGGPGIAYSLGLSWVFLAAVQYPVSLLIMGVLGRQLQRLGHEHDLYDLADYIKLRYNSRFYGKFCAALIAVVLLLGLMIAIMGGSRLLQGALSDWGLSYRGALLLFSFSLAIYTLLGGFRAVVLTDILQGFWMLLVSLLLLFFLWRRAGGAAGLANFAAANPAVFSVDSGGALPLSYTANFTVLVGFGMIVQPVSFSRLLAMKKGTSLRQSILISIAVIGLLTFMAHFIGFLGRIVLPNIDVPDQLMGHISQLFRTPQYGLLGSVFSGMLVSALLAAVMSTADSTLNTLAMTIYRHLLPRRWSNIFAWRAVANTSLKSSTTDNCQAKAAEHRHFQLSRLLAAASILLTALLALHPPKLLVTLNLYTLGATQAALLWPVTLGMYTRRPDGRAACSSSLVGLGSYALLNKFFANFGGVAILPYSLLLGIVAYFATDYLASASRKVPAKSDNLWH